MAFTDNQVRLLKAKLDPRYIRTRSSNGTRLSYVEGWHVIAEANRIFGYEAWDRRTISSSCVWTEARGGSYRAVYVAKVRVTVRAGEMNIVREGSGTCEASALTPGQAHELALKGAETDATKRALATFGNPFGLALYNREQSGVSKPRQDKSPTGPWVLRSATGSSIATYDNSNVFIEALRQAMSEAHAIELLYDVWEQNIETLRALHRHTKEESGIIPKLVAHLRSCAVALVKEANKRSAHEAAVSSAEAPENTGLPHKVDKSLLTIAEPKRIRCKEHLRYVASQPCLICGRSPSQAHHLRHAQTRGLGLKVSDEFVVPLCAIHHHQIHTTEKEEAWWKERKIDPLTIAGNLWKRSRERYPAAREASAAQSVEIPNGKGAGPPS